MAHDHELPPPVLEEVSPGIYSYVQPDGTWFINNCGFVVGSDRVVSIDTTSTEARTRAYQAAIASVTDLPVATVINTHHHGDHTHGNYLFDGAAIVAHRRCREVMMATGRIADYSAAFPGVTWGHLEFCPPTQVFEGEMDLVVGDVTVELREFGEVAHTDGDIYAWLPGRGVLFSGDLVFHGGTPFALFGSIEGTLRALDVLEGLGAEVLVPGHGPACRGDAITAAFDDQRRYLRFVQEQAAAGIADGLDPLAQARRTDLGEFGRWTDSERLAGNLHVAYRESGHNDGFSIEGAIGDMIALNGGALPRCLA